MRRRIIVSLAQLVLLVSAVLAVVLVPQGPDEDAVELKAREGIVAQVTELREHLLANVGDDAAGASAEGVPPWQPHLYRGQSYLLLEPGKDPLVIAGDGEPAGNQTLVDRYRHGAPGSARQSVELIETPTGPVYVGVVEVILPGSTQTTVHLIVQPLAEELAAVDERTRDRAIVAVPVTGLLMLAWMLHAGRRQRAATVTAPAAPSVATPPTRQGVAAESPPDSARRPLGAVVIEGFGSRLAFGLLTFTLPLYAYDLGMSLSAIGLLLATNMAVSVVLKPFMGVVIDHIGVRRAYVIAVVLRTLVLVTLVLATGPVHLFIARALHGVSIAMRDPASSTVLAALGGKKSVAQRFAWYQAIKTVAGSGGQFAAGILITVLSGSYTPVFVIAAVLSGLPLIVVLVALRGPLVEGLRLPQPPPRTPLPRDLRRALLPYAGLGAMITGTAYLMANLLPVLAVEYMGLSPAAAGSLYLVKTVVSLTGPAWGWVADRVSLRLVLGVRALGNCLSSLIWLVMPTYAGLMAGKIADDVGKAAFAPAWGSVMAKVSDLDPVRRSRVLAWMSSAEDAGEMAGPIVAGVIWTAFGLPALLVLRAVLAIATELYAVVVGRRVQLDADDEVPADYAKATLG